MKNYRELTEEIKRKINPENYVFEKAFSKELSSISYSDALTFIRIAMKSVEPTYTQKTKEAGNRAKEHLNRELENKTFRYQGSVMTDTHIRGFSDIDLLVISEKFYTYDSHNVNEALNNPQIRTKLFSSNQINKLEEERNMSSYKGDTLSDLKELRSDSEKVLNEKYNICNISKPKSIKITNLDLNRDVDVVIANWYDDIKSIVNDKGDFRGIQIYDKHQNKKGKDDYPFLSIKRINEKSAYTNGRLKKMIRFLKNVKSHSDYDIELTSFDINAICYDINTSKYKDSPFYDLVKVIYYQLDSISSNKEHSDNLKSVDEHEYIFRNNSDKLENLKMIMSEVKSIFNDLNLVPIYG